MGGVREQKAQLVLAERQRDLRLGLAGTKMKVIKIVRDRLVERRQFGVDEQVMMPGVRLIEAGRRDTHIQQTKADNRVRRNIGAIGGEMEYTLASLGEGCRVPAAACGGAAACSTTFTLMRSDTSGGE